MEISAIMKRLSDSRTANQEAVKTASAEPKKKNGNGTGSPELLRAALRDTLAATPQTEKTAAAKPAAPQHTENPAGGLLKMASDLVSAEEEAMQKQASILGAAMCDGFMNRFAQYDDAAAQVAPAPQQTKTAAYAPQTQDQALEMIKTAAQDPEFQKFASQNPDLVKEAYDLGYQQTMAALVKEAQADFDQGYDEGLDQIHKLAAASYIHGAQTINQVLRSMQQQQ